MKSNDTQFEAMASYFRSMLNPVSSQEIEEKLAGKLASSGLVADGVVKVSSEQNRPEESPVIEESVKVTDESSDVVETDGRKIVQLQMQIRVVRYQLSRLRNRRKGMK